jgi:hypothetical protein
MDLAELLASDLNTHEEITAAFGYRHIKATRCEPLVAGWVPTTPVELRLALRVLRRVADRPDMVGALLGPQLRFEGRISAPDWGRGSLDVYMFSTTAGLVYVRDWPSKVGYVTPAEIDSHFQAALQRMEGYRAKSRLSIGCARLKTGGTTPGPG